MASPLPNETCSLCAHLPAQSYASQKVGSQEKDTTLPAQTDQLVPDTGSEDIRLPVRYLHCTKCSTRYKLESHHEYLVDGSEDTQELTRL